MPVHMLRYIRGSCVCSWRATALFVCASRGDEEARCCAFRRVAIAAARAKADGGRDVDSFSRAVDVNPFVVLSFLLRSPGSDLLFVLAFAGGACVHTFAFSGQASARQSVC